MINTDKERFKRIYTEMLVGLVPREEQLMGVGIYFKGLTSYAIEYVEQAGRQFLSEHGQKFLPTVGEWAERASQLDRKNQLSQTAKALLPERTADGQRASYYCKYCEDTSWRYNKDRLDKASGLMVSSVSRCDCQMTNPILAAKRVRALEFSQGRTK
jgi:hypothetical protein